MKVLVVTVVHRPSDARVYGRQIRSLLEAGHEVTLAAPWTATSAAGLPGVIPIDLPRAVGRSRRRALIAARKLLAERSSEYDLVVIHNPELVLVAGVSDVPVVFDVHEDLAASLVDKEWLPAMSAGLFRPGIRALERYAESHFHIILAEASYQERFDRPHPIVPNEPVVPDHVDVPGTERVVHLGRHSVGRGVHEIIEAARLAPRFHFELLGWADDDMVAAVEDASKRQNIEWLGELDNDMALSRIGGALAGLCLLHDLPNYRNSRPTKVVEYMSRGVPVITTPLPVAVEIVEANDCGLVVPFESAQAVVNALETLRADARLRVRLSANGHRAALDHFDWRRSGPQFVSLLEGWAAR